MPRLPRISSGNTAVCVLERLGFYRARQTGSHVVLKKQISGGEIVCVVPLRRELKIGTLSGILRQVQVTPEKFLENL
ncbi:MAG: type II toxin-antitoxin system HicA family toxin [Gloeocapsa sp. UFS-A4-WI-NPMV-4B04]|nr:type II toxin-antitoxin system HicA family toxin [Gloeocapsa sp. UFS-A4-WI-NPMV-4B04]